MTLFGNNKKFKELYTAQERISESNRIIAKYPDYIPVIIDCSEKLGQLRKQKFLVQLKFLHLIFFTLFGNNSNLKSLMLYLCFVMIQ